MVMLSEGHQMPAHSQDCGWHALYTRHQHEKLVARVLMNRDFNVFLPLYSTVHQWKDRAKTVILPLFPCYLFVRGGLDRRLDILKTPGVHGFVGAAGQPAVIPKEEVEAVRRVVERSIRVEPHPFLRCGDGVRVTRGPLAGIEGILVRKKNLFRLVLSVELLGKSVAVEVDVSMVERMTGRSVAVSGLPHTPTVPTRSWEGVGYEWAC